jgi:hypothetical protein
MKECKACGFTKPLSEYSLTPAGHPRGKCKVCRSIQNSDIAARSRKLKFKYGITHDQYLLLLEKQGGRCCMCDKTAEEQHHGVLDVDHNHETGEVRGLLCGPCNRLLGFAGDNPEVLLRGAQYLQERGDYSWS